METKLSKASHWAQILSFILALWLVLRPPARSELEYAVGMSQYLPYILPAALVLSILLAAGLHFAAAVVAHKSMSSKSVPTVPGSRQPNTNHEDCERKIRNLESTVARLQRNEQDHGVLISGKETHIEQLKTELAGLGWLREIAAKQATSMHRYISIQDCRIMQHELFRRDPYLEFWILVANRSVFDIQLADIAGVISFYGRELTEGLEWKTPDRVVAWGDKESFSFRQRLNRDDVVHILNQREDFRFDGLKIPAVGPLSPALNLRRHRRKVCRGFDNPSNT